MRRASSGLTVLGYHGVDDPESFERQLRFLTRRRRPVSLEEVVRAARRGRGLPQSAVLLTFDDGARSILEVGLPLLRDHGVPAVSFVIAGLLDTEQPFWWVEALELAELGGTADDCPGLRGRPLTEALKQLPDERRRAALDQLRATASGPARPTPQLRRHELRLLESAGIAVGNHSLTHPSLPRCDDQQLTVELTEAHRVLTDSLGHVPLALAYPHGHWDLRVLAAARDLGYAVGFTFDPLVSPLPFPEPLLISRLHVESWTAPDKFATIVSGLFPLVWRTYRMARGQAAA